MLCGLQTPCSNVCGRGFSRGLQMDWNEERIEALTRLWREGLSASQVARQLGGVSRSAVIGKVHRLGIAGRDAPSRPQTLVGRPASRTRASAGGTRRQTAPRAPRPPVLPRAPFEAIATATIHTLTSHGCRWPIGEPDQADFGFCGRSAHRRRLLLRRPRADVGAPPRDADEAEGDRPHGRSLRRQRPGRSPGRRSHPARDRLKPGCLRREPGDDRAHLGGAAGAGDRRRRRDRPRRGAAGRRRGRLRARRRSRPGHALAARARSRSLPHPDRDRGGRPRPARRKCGSGRRSWAPSDACRT